MPSNRMSASSRPGNNVEVSPISKWPLIWRKPGKLKEVHAGILQSQDYTARHHVG